MNGRADFREPNAEVPRPIPHIGPDYILTEEERRVFTECSEEIFWFRSVPLAATSMLITQGLISKGILSSHPRYGSIPKLIFACIMGYFAGKFSYVKTCQEKFKNLFLEKFCGQAKRGALPHLGTMLKSQNMTQM
ncbi:OCIA domain-containing protein 1 isoform X1 [Sigmodon hispidus]